MTILKTNKGRVAIVAFAFSMFLEYKFDVKVAGSTPYLVGLFWGLGSGILLGACKWFDEQVKENRDAETNSDDGEL